jgi:hypothetical protein
MTKLLPSSGREWAVAAASGAIVGGTVEALHLYTRSYGIPTVDELGGLLGGIAAILAVIGGGISWLSWGKRRRQERREGAAELAIHAAWDFYEVLKRVSIAGSRDAEPADSLIRELMDDDLNKKMREARASVAAHLGRTGVARHLLRLVSHRDQMVELLRVPAHPSESEDYAYYFSSTGLGAYSHFLHVRETLSAFITSGNFDEEEDVTGNMSDRLQATLAAPEPEGSEPPR